MISWTSGPEAGNLQFVPNMPWSRTYLSRLYFVTIVDSKFVTSLVCQFFMKVSLSWLKFGRDMCVTSLSFDKYGTTSQLCFIIEKSFNFLWLENFIFNEWNENVLPTEFVHRDGLWLNFTRVVNICCFVNCVSRRFLFNPASSRCGTLHWPYNELLKFYSSPYAA